MELDRAIGRGTRGDGDGAAPWVERLARVGFATKGVVYLLVGGLALMAGLGRGGALTGGEGAIRTIGSQPFGQILLLLTGIGLVGYALWRFVQGALDPEREGTDGKGIAKRLGYVGSGLVHGALAVAACQLAVGSGGGSGGQQTYLAKVMGEPFGRVVVAVIGGAVILAGLYQLHKAYTAKFERGLRLGEMSATERTWSQRVGRIGYAARGIVFPIVGFFIVKSAIEYDPSQARGIGGALATLSSQSYGTLISIVVAAGLVAYGVFQFVLARYRQIPAIA